MDYASPATRAAGQRLIAAELEKLPEGSQKAELLDRLARIRDHGAHDLYF